MTGHRSPEWERYGQAVVRERVVATAGSQQDDQTLRRWQGGSPVGPGGSASGPATIARVEDPH
jgi:hypothetical protein